jgi:hypothetical protein
MPLGGGLRYLLWSMAAYNVENGAGGRSEPSYFNYQIRDAHETV